METQLLYFDDSDIDNKSWSDSELDFLKQKFPTMDTVYIAKEMNRTVSSIQTKAYNLGLKKMRKEKKDLKFIAMGQ
jgi:hypothetical protein